MMLPRFKRSAFKIWSVEHTHYVTQELFDQVLLGFAQEFPGASRADVLLSVVCSLTEQNPLYLQNQ